MPLSKLSMLLIPAERLGYAQQRFHGNPEQVHATYSYAGYIKQRRTMMQG
jgi:hypothetical protein